MSSNFQDILSTPFPDAVRYVLKHEQKKSFRWLFIIELLLFILLFICLIPIMIIVLILSGGEHGDVDFNLFDRLDGRMYRRWMELSFLQKDKDGKILVEATTIPEDQATRDAAIGSVLHVAQAEKMVVVETLGESLSEILNVWYGGNPFLSSPTRMSPEMTSRIFKEHQIKEEQEKTRWSISIPDQRNSRIGAFFILFFFGIFLIFTEKGRRSFSRHWKLLIYKQRVETKISVDKHGIYYKRQQGETIFSPRQFSAQEILGVTWSATMAAGKSPRRISPRLRIIERTHTTDFILDAALGKAISDRITSALIELGAGQKMFALKTHCPFCGALYNLEEQESCSSCGAPPLIN